MSDAFLAVCDPNWAMDSGGGGKGADFHYDLANVEDIGFAMRMSPPWRDVGSGVLWMWSTTLALCSNGHSAPHQLARALDFRVCASWVWAKVDRIDAAWLASHLDGVNDGHLNDGVEFARSEVAALGLTAPAARPGIGFYEMCEHEFLFLCRRGDLPAGAHERLKKVRPRSVIYAPRGEHSAKPEEAWSQVIEPVSRAILPGVRGVEFNARVRRPGWAGYGRLDGEKQPLRYEIGVD